MNQNTVAVENQDVIFDDDLSFLDDLIEGVEAEAAAAVEADDDLLASVINEVEADEEMAEIYAAQVEVTEVDGTVEVEPEVVVAEPEADEETPVAVAPVVKAAKAPKATGSRAERIRTQLGADFIDKTTLTPAWATKTEGEHTADFDAIIGDMAEYVGDKAVNLFKFIKVGGGLNEVTRRGFEVLLRDGQIVGGDNGNMIVNLLSKPYSIGTSRAQCNQIMQLFTDLEIGKRVSRGVVVVNDESIILEVVKALLGK